MIALLTIIYCGILWLLFYKLKLFRPSKVSWSVAAGVGVVHVVYTPMRTPLLADAAHRGHAAVDGLGMLLHQARPGFAAWFGVEPEVSPELREYVLRAPELQA